MELELNQAPDVNLSFVSETNEIILQLLEAPEINLEFTGVVFGERGLPGKDGIDGNNISAICGENINSHTPVVLIDNKLFIMDSANNLHQFSFVGFTKTSGLENEIIEVESKKIELNNWNLIPNKNYLIGRNGQLILENNLTNTFTKVIGFSQDSNTLLIYKNYDSILTT